jgi:hypothetical protein
VEKHGKKMLKNINRITLFLLLVNVTPWAGAASISMQVDRDPVHIDESFQIIFESKESVDGDPDFSPIERDFTILNTGRSSNTSIVNGKVTRASQWILTVMAKKTGVLNVPAIRFGRDRSQPGTVNVTVTGSGATHSQGDIFLEVEIMPEDPYVQAQVIYTVRLFRSVAINNASLSEPQLSGGDAVIEKLGEDKSYEARKAGIRYIVVERRYAIFPQNSGDITIDPVTFQGRIGRDSGFFIDPFGPPPRVVIKKSNSIALNVKPVPQTFTGKHWLPSRKLELQEQWSVDPSAIPEGEPVTRTLKITANELTASQLPDVGNHLPEILKQYPDQPVMKDTMDSHGMSGIREEKIAVIPSQAGEYILPEIKIPWWNTKTDKMEYAVLPERTITILPTITTRGKSTAVETELIDTDTTDNVNTEMVDEPSQIGVEPVANDYWKWISIALATGWCLTLLLFWKTGGLHPESTGPSKKQENVRRVVSNLKHACQRNDPVATKAHILKWSGMVWPDSPPSSLGQIEKRFTGLFSEQLRTLNQTLYSSAQLEWNGSDFFNSFTSARKEIEKTENEEPTGLEPLYKL